MNNFRQDVESILTALLPEQKFELIQPPDHAMGDLALACFPFAKVLRKDPGSIAQEFAAKLKPKGLIKKIETKGAYLNFFADKQKLAKIVIAEILKRKEKYGSRRKNGIKVMVEYPSPNTNKPLHLGHIRNMLLGKSVCNLLSFSGYSVIPTDLVNDRGVHICKSMLAYKKWGNSRLPDKKGDHFVGDFYVMYSKMEKEHPELENEARELLIKWESGDKETVALWKKMRKWALDGFAETYKTFDVVHKKTFYESEIYQQGKELIMDGLNRGLFQKDEKGAIVVDFEKDSLGKKVLLREDGTGIYITQDLYLAKLKFDEFKIDSSVYVVANEQNYHFQVLFKLLKMLGYSFADKCVHLSYGMIFLPEGRMKSREGTVVDADELVLELKSMAASEIRKRHQLSDDELEKRSAMIGLGALKFFVLKYDSLKDFVYDPSESMSFEGETGPYVQYVHARICSIMAKHNNELPKIWKAELLADPREERLISLLSQFPERVKEGTEHYKPHLLVQYLMELSQAFNEFYHACPILQAEENMRGARLMLIVAVKQVISSGLSLLGIESPEMM